MWPCPPGHLPQQSHPTLLLCHNMIDLMQAELDASGWELGVPPVVAPQAHYGRPQDAPAQPTVFAGREFRWGWVGWGGVT